MVYTGVYYVYINGARREIAEPKNDGQKIKSVVWSREKNSDN